MNIGKKVSGDVPTPPVLTATMKCLNGGELTVVFNASRDSFEYDVIRIELSGKALEKGVGIISRDDLCAVLINGYERAKR